MPDNRTEIIKIFISKIPDSGATVVVGAWFVDGEEFGVNITTEDIAQGAYDILKFYEDFKEKNERG